MESRTTARVAPALDEDMFQQLLEAAYILQEHNDRERKSRPALGPAETLAAIAATQQILHSKTYDLVAAARLVAQQLQKITNAVGVAIAVISDNQLEYCAAIGTVAALAGMKMPMEASVSKFLEADQEQRASTLQKHDGRGPILLPIYHETEVAGLIDLRFEHSAPVEEHTVGCCQVMAGLMSEVVGRSARSDLKKVLSSERANMMGVLERLRPQLQRLAGETKKAPVETPIAPELRFEPIRISEVTEEPVKSVEPEEPVEPAEQRPPHSDLGAVVSAISDGSMKTSAISACSQCGHPFGEGELFCGRCGTPRLMELTPVIEPEQSETITLRHDESLDKVTPLEAKPEAQAAGDDETGNTPLPAELTRALEQLSLIELPQVDGSSALAALPEQEVLPTEEIASEPETLEPETKLEIVAAPGATDTTALPSWGSAAGTLKWLKSLQKADSPFRKWMETHRGDLSVVLAMIVLLVAVSGVGPHQIQARPSTSAQPNLTLFERMLVSLGLAEAPPAPVSMGNPNVEVWVDVHTALYYCPGSDLFGKTPDGRTESQRDAQLDEFQPAARKNCQ